MVVVLENAVVVSEMGAFFIQHWSWCQVTIHPVGGFYCLPRAWNDSKEHKRLFKISGVSVKRRTQTPWTHRQAWGGCIRGTISFHKGTTHLKGGQLTSGKDLFWNQPHTPKIPLQGQKHQVPFLDYTCPSNCQMLAWVSSRGVKVPCHTSRGWKSILCKFLPGHCGAARISTLCFLPISCRAQFDLGKDS